MKEKKMKSNKKMGMDMVDKGKHMKPGMPMKKMSHKKMM